MADINISKLQEIKNLCTELNLISVYDTNCYSFHELYYMLANRVNDLIIEIKRFEGVVSDELIEQTNTIDGLLKQGMIDEVIKKLNELVADGTMDRIINHTVFNELNNEVAKKVNKDDLNYVDVRNFGVLGDYDPTTDSGTDDTLNIQKAIDYAYQNRKSIVKFDSKGYVIKGQLTIHEGITLVGTRESFTQGIATNTDNGSNRYRLVTETTLIIKPENIGATPLNFMKQSGIKNMSIVQYQDFASTNEESIIKYGYTIKGQDGFNAYNLRFIGAYNFIYATGEAIRIEKIYGYSFGTAITLENSPDVSFIQDIHLNPNVTRPTTACINLSRSREDSVAIKLRNCDGVIINNFFCIMYRTGLKAFSCEGEEIQFTVNNFLMDVVGLAFDLDIDSGWANHISNGTVIYGFSDDPNHAGLVKFSKSVGDKIFSNIFFDSISCDKTNRTNANVTPNYLINFDFIYSFNVMFNKISFDGKCTPISNTGSYVTGEIRSASNLFDLKMITARQSYIENTKLNDINEGIPKGWIKGEGTVTCKKTDDGFTKVSGGELVWRQELEEVSIVNIVGYVHNCVNSDIYLIGYDEGFQNSYSQKVEIEPTGRFRIVAKYPKKLFDLQIKANNGYVTVKEIKGFLFEGSY